MSDRDDLDRLADDLRGLRPRPVSATVRARLVSRMNEPRRLHSAWVGRSVVALAASAAFVAVLSTLQVEEPPAPAEAPEASDGCECRFRFVRPVPPAARATPRTRPDRFA